MLIRKRWSRDHCACLLYQCECWQGWWRNRPYMIRHLAQRHGIVYPEDVNVALGGAVMEVSDAY